MTIFEKFASFASGLPEERRREIEDLLASIMNSESAEFDLMAEELAEIDRRMADPNPEYADPAEIEAIFARHRKA